MKILKNENGVITLLVLVSIIFLLVALLTTYMLISRKVQLEKNVIAETRTIYAPSETMNEIYNSYFSKSNIVPIYTVEQLLAIGDGTKKFYIDGKYYTFTNDENTIYMLMNNLKFKASDFPTKLSSGYWTPVGENTALISKFEGKKYTIEVEYSDDGNYSIMYSKANGFSEPEYDVEVTLDAGATSAVVNDAKIYVNNEERRTSSGPVKIKRVEESTVKADAGDNFTKPQKTITILNPAKILGIDLTFEDIT